MDRIRDRENLLINRHRRPDIPRFEQFKHIWSYFYDKQTKDNFWITAGLMGVSSALWVTSPYIRKLLVDAMTKTIEASIAGTGASTSAGIFGRIKQALLVGSEVKGGLSLAKFIAGLGFYGLCKITASFIY